MKISTILIIFLFTTPIISQPTNNFNNYKGKGPIQIDNNPRGEQQRLLELNNFKTFSNYL